MPWVDVEEPFSTPPRSTGPMSAPGDAATVDVDDSWGSVLEAELQGSLDVSGCERLEVRGSVLRGVSLIASPGIELDVTACELIECDLTAVRFATVANTRFEGCKLSGVDFGSGALRDVEFDRTVMRMSTLRMATLERVVFRGCTLDDVDLFEASLEDVSFPDSDLRAVELDKASFRRVDLRGAVALDLRSGRRFEGCVVSPAQVVPLAHLFAHAAGVSIQRPPDG